MNLDPPRVDLSPPARLHGCVGVDVGLGLPSRLAATRASIHALTSVSSHPTAFADSRIGEGKLPAAISRYSDERLSPVVRWTSRRRNMRSWPGSNWIDGAGCLLRVRAGRACMEPAGHATGKSDFDGFILAVLGCAGIGRDSYDCWQHKIDAPKGEPICVQGFRLRRAASFLFRSASSATAAAASSCSSACRR